MASSDNDIELRFGAETSQLETELQGAAKQVEQMSTDMSKATASANAYGTSLDAVRRYNQQAQDGQQKMARAAQDSAAAAQNLAEKYGNVGAQAAEFGKGQRELGDLLRSGSITQAEYTSRLATLRSSVFGASQAIDGASKSALNFGMSTSHAVNGARALIDELSSGRMRQADGTFTRLLIEIGQASPAIALLAVTTVGIGAAMAVAAVHAEEMARAVNEAQSGFIATGRAADFTKGELQDFIQQLSELPNISKADAEKTVDAMSRMPELSKPIFAELLGMVDDFAVATGQKAPEAARELGAALEDPRTGAERLDKQLNFLTGTEWLAIKTAEEHGDRMKAQQIVIDALKRRIQDLSENAMTPLEKAENNVKKAWEELNVGMKNTNGLATATQSIADLIKWLEKANDRMREFGKLFHANLFGGLSQETPTGGTSGKSVKPKGPGRPSGNDQEAERQRRYKEDLRLATEHAGKASERRKLEADINRLLEDRKMAKTNDERQVFDDAIAAKREQLGRLNKPKKQAGASTQMDQWRAQFEKMRADAIESTGKEDYQAEIRFWQQKLSVAKQGSKEYTQIESEISRLRISSAREGTRESQRAAREDYRSRIADLKEQQQAAGDDLQTKIKLQQQMLAVDKQYYGEKSTQYKDHQRELDRLEQQRTQQQIKQASDEIALTAKKSENEIAIEEEHARTRLQLGQMTELEYDQFLIEEENKRSQIRLQALNDQMALNASLVKEHDKFQKQIEQQTAQHNLKLAKMQDQLVITMQKPWHDMVNAMTNAMSSGAQQMIRGQQSFRGMMLSIGEVMLDTFIGIEAKKLSAAITGQTAQTAATTAGEATRTGVTVAATATQTTVQSAASAKVIMMKAWEAAASVYASIAAIPYVGPFLAPAMAIGAAVEIGRFVGHINSAAGGWEVPNDQIMQVHKKEVILPAKWAQRLANAESAMQGSGPGGDTHIHIHTPDAEGMRRLVMNNKHIIADAVKSSFRDGKR